MKTKTHQFVALLSSGLDSPIATYLMMKKGYNAVLLSYDISKYPSQEFKEKISKMVHLLKNLTSRSITLYIADHYKALSEFVEKGKRKLTCILCKSYMLYGAYLLAELSGANFIINGDILGEQASQTLNNISAIQNTMPQIPVVRPLIGFEKKEVLKISHELGFYELSTLPDLQCNFNPMYPETHTQNEELQACIDIIDMKRIAQSSLKNAQVLNVE